MPLFLQQLLLSSTFLLKSDALLNISLAERDEVVAEMFALLLGNDATMNFTAAANSDGVTVLINVVSCLTYLQPLLQDGCCQEYSAALQAALDTTGMLAFSITGLNGFLRQLLQAP